MLRDRALPEAEEHRRLESEGPDLGDLGVLDACQHALLGFDLLALSPSRHVGDDQHSVVADEDVDDPRVVSVTGFSDSGQVVEDGFGADMVAVPRVVSGDMPYDSGRPEFVQSIDVAVRDSLPGPCCDLCIGVLHAPSIRWRARVWTDYHAAGMDWHRLFDGHLGEISRRAEESLAVQNDSGGVGGEGLVLHAGRAARYPADDLALPFRTLPHFARFAPVSGPEHLLVFRPGQAIRLAQVTPCDYWEEPSMSPAHPFQDLLDVVRVSSFEAGAAALGDLSDCVYLGSCAAAAAALGIAKRAVEPQGLVSALDWYRAYKTDYEVACIREANRTAARGHVAARKAVFERKTEREIHAAYLVASGALDGETPYPNIVAWDDRSSILHYQRKRVTAPDPGHSFLIDAGATQYGYASDITRTYALPGVHPAFVQALDSMERLQQRLTASIEPGASYVDLHAQAVCGVAEILCDIGVLRVGLEEADERGLARAFLPHGLGHHLGLQVHDVAGQQVSREGEYRAPPAQYPHLRTTRDLAVGHVVTLEPGLYFIPQLLEEHRSGDTADAFDWSLIDALLPCGGIRIEDDIHVTSTGAENLTRPVLAGHANPFAHPA